MGGGGGACAFKKEKQRNNANENMVRFMSSVLIAVTTS